MYKALHKSFRFERKLLYIYMNLYLFYVIFRFHKNIFMYK